MHPYFHASKTPHQAHAYIRRRLASPLFLALFAFSQTTHGYSDTAPSAPAQPNIILILIDDLGINDLSCTGSTYYETPNIDRLAAQGMLFTDAYAAAANCAPSRASLLTGMYPPRHGVYTVGESNRGPIAQEKLIPIPNAETLAPQWRTIANVLDEAGYTTASIGKWHLGDDPQTGPFSHGFQVNIAGSDKGSPSSYFSPYNMPHLSDGPPGEYLTDRLTDEAMKFISQNKDHPFFLYLSHYAVHVPLGARQEIITRYKSKPGSQGQNNPTYAAMIESVDQSVGRIMMLLDELAIANHTLLIFTSDNGGVHPITSMHPFRGWKGMLYEGGIRVPFIARWPACIAPGSVSHEPIVNVDLLPTFTEVAGGKLPTTQPADGVSLLPLFRGNATLGRDAIFWHAPVYLPGEGIGHGLRWTPGGAIRMGNLSLLEFFEDNHLELYDLANDAGEKTSLNDPALLRQMHARLAKWREIVHAPVPDQPNPHYNPEAKPQKKQASGD